MTVHEPLDSLPDTPEDVPTTGFLGLIQRGLNAVNTVLAFFSALALAVAGCVLTWEVIGRYFLEIPSDWQDELSVFLLVGATFASAAWTQARRGHVGIEALGALLPPRAGRGLVLIDPPYEAPDEFERVFAGLQRAHRRFAHGVHVAWYPVKHGAPVRALHARLTESGMRDILAAILLLRAPLDAARLNGCGLIVINPPFRFEQEAPAILDALLQRLGTREAGEGALLERLAEE